MKKIAQRLLLIVLVMCVCVACSSNQNSTGKTEESSSTPTSAAGASTAPSGGDTAAKEEPLKLTMHNLSYFSFAEDSAIEKEIEKITNTELDIQWIPSNEYSDRLNVLLASGNLPDLTVTESPAGQMYAGQVLTAIKSGAFLDITEFIEDPEFASKYPNLGKIEKSAWEAIKVGGKIYGFPRGQNPKAGASGIVIRQDLLEQANLQVPQTIEEFTDVITKLASPPNRYGLALSSKDLDSTQTKAFAAAFTGVHDWGIDGSGKFIYQSFMPEYKDFLVWLNTLYTNKIIDPEFPLEQGGSDFYEGKSAAMLTYWWNWDQSPNKLFFKDEFLATGINPSLIGVVPLKGPKAYTVAVRPGTEHPSLLSVKFPRDKVPQLLKFLDQMESSEIMEVRANGVEGVHYTIKDGQMVVNEQAMQIEGPGWYDFLTGVTAGPYDFLLRAKEVLQMTDEQLAIMGQMYKVSEEKAKDIDISSYFLDSPTFQSKWTTLTKDLNDNRVKVVIGAMSIAQWDHYVQSMVVSDTYQQIIKEFNDSKINN